MKQHKYKIWSDGFDDEETAETLEASEPEYAAEQWVAKYHCELDYPDEVGVMLKDLETGKVTKWTVTVESRPHFSANISEAQS